MNLETAFDLSSEMLCVLDLNYQVVTINQSFVNTLKVSKEDVLGVNFQNLLTDNDKESFVITLQKLQEDKSKSLKLTLEEEHYNNINLRLRISKKEDFYYMIANQVILQDAPLARFRRFFDMSLLDILVIASKDRKIVYSNKNFPEILGYHWQEIQNILFENLICADQRESLVADLDSLKANEGVAQTIISKCLHKTSGDKWISWRIIYAKSNYYIVGHDITEKKHQELKIQKLLNDTIQLNEDLGFQNAKLMQSQAELQNTLSELETRNFELDQFVYKVSHDLRAPLTSILGLVNLAIMELDDKVRIEEYFKMIEKSTQRLDTFVQSLLNYSRSNRVEVRIEAIDFREMIDEILNNLQFLDYFEDIDKEVDIQLKGNVYSESIRLKIIFNNIISNAIKYQNTKQENKKLKISITEIADNNVQLIFEDNGIGIAPEYQKDVFNMFFRATENAQGSGLGLYIVKQTIDKLQGTIKLESDYGKFTRFIFTIPNHTEDTKTD